MTLGGGAPLLEVLGLTFAAGLAVASVLPLWRRNLRRTPLHTWGMVIAHLGVAVSIAGMASDSAFKLERLAAVRIGDSVAVGPFSVRLDDVHPAIGPNWSALEANLVVSRNGGTPFTAASRAALFLDARDHHQRGGDLDDGRRPALHRARRRRRQGRWQLRLWWKPFVTLIWAGGFMIAFGGLIALIRPGTARAAQRGRRGAGVKRWLIWVPLAAFVLVFALVAFGLRFPTDRLVHSAMVGKPVPGIALPRCWRTARASRPTRSRASRGCSTSSRAGASRAWPRRRR